MSVKAKIRKKNKIRLHEGEHIIALAGNPNVGKSTIFNYITGLKQHTGNWTGKTVENAYGHYIYEDERYLLVDLPGTYSLITQSKDEAAARDFICFKKPDAVVVVADATALERNMNLVLQVLEVTHKVVLCINLIDEAGCKGIHVDTKELSKRLNIPVVATNAKCGKGIHELKRAVKEVINIDECEETVRYCEEIERAVSIMMPIIEKRWICLRLLEDNNEIKELIYKENPKLNREEVDEVVVKAKHFLENEGIDVENLQKKELEAFFGFAKNIVADSVTIEVKKDTNRDRKIDKILTSKMTGFPIMMIFLALILWITIVGANYPSRALSMLFSSLEEIIRSCFSSMNMPSWLVGVMIDGMYRTLSWVIAVMLPPMAIFFPLFTILEDAGYLPRVAFNLDKSFCRACAHGKQALTTCMGFGCNAVGVTGCNIIESPRERMIAILTNNFVPCNGRFSSIILLSAVLISVTESGASSSILSVLIVFCAIAIGICMTFLTSKLLSMTILKGMPSHFVLELPPYRTPKIRSVIVRSVLDRTLFVLGRAAAIAAPAGVIIWLMANITVGENSILMHIAEFLEPFANIFGLDGNILLAFILGIPANEIVVPLMVMGYSSQSVLSEIAGAETISTLFANNGWTLLTVINVILFMLMHFPCATTLLTIKKETKSIKWTLLAFIIPTVAGLIACFLTTNAARFILYIF